MRAGNGLLYALTGCALCGGAAAADDVDSLFDLDKPVAADDAAGSGLRWGGYGEFGAAYTYAEPAHWSKLRMRAELAASGRLGARARFKLAARVDGDAAYDVESGHYPGPVQRDQRSGFALREAYLDFSSGDWEFRVGRQHIVWGEVVGLFLADVVSARDLREFLLPEFEALRIPQWAARAEFHGAETFFELLWIPVPSYDKVGKPGADFYPFPLPAGTRVRNNEPDRDVGDGNWGLRASRLMAGWDLAAFYYSSRDVAPTLYRTSPAPAFELRHDRIRQVGATLSKDMGNFVLKGEAVHTRGRSFNSTDPAAPFGLKSSDTLQYIVGIDIPLQDVWRFNVQHYARLLDDHDRTLDSDRYETGFTLLVNRKFGASFEAEVLMVAGINRPDYMLRPKLVWHITQEWRGQFGADVFGGRDKSLFGRFDDRDRVYVEVRRWF